MSSSTDRLAAVIAGAAQLAEQFAERAPAHDRAGTFPYENFADLRSAGWPGLTVPEHLGGLGARLPDAVQLLETLAQGDGSTALAMAMHVQTLGAAVETEAWPAAALAEVGRAAVERGALVNSCASEPELGSPSRGGLPRTVAHRDAKGWTVTGRKNFASLAPVLDYFVIPAALAGEPDTIGRFLVPRAAGVQVEENWDPMGMRATGSHDIVLEEVAVPDSALLYRQSAAAPDPYRPSSNAWFTLCVTAVYLGVGQAAVAAAVRFAHERVPTALGQSIATLDSVQMRLGAAELDLLVARRYLADVAARWSGDAAARGQLGAEVVAAKVFVTNAALRATDAALRVVGGAAMRRDLPLERLYRDVRAGLYHPPSDDQAHALLGRLALERFRLAPPN
jgi:alkylation response protein AidB-like acyl-CoA dehydrogenase